MTRNFRFALLGLSALACVGLVVELVLPILAISPETLESTRARDEHLAAKKGDALVAEIIKRPLFTDGRAPPRPPQVVKAEPPHLQGRLAGVMLQSDSREALFTRPGGKPVAVKEGDVIDGWTVGKIQEDQVLLTSAFGEQVVKPTNGGADEITTAPRPVAKKNAPAKPGLARQPLPPQQRNPVRPPLPGNKAMLEPRATHFAAEQTGLSVPC
jgi:type II secretory pathway component PulC